MINKTITFGRNPEQAGVKDAVHVAIVSVRAAKTIEPGGRCKLNEHREAIPTDSKGIGVADPFLKGSIARGETFWLMMDNREIKSVLHVWDHKLDFSAPEREVELDKWILETAVNLGVEYDLLMRAARTLVESGVSTEYKGSLTEEQLEEKISEECDFWYNWTDETGYEFENEGSACCPEYDHPDMEDLFHFPEA